MKLLLDSCIWGPTGPALRAADHDVDWVGDWSEDPGDLRILERAQAEGRVLVTAGNGFGELVAGAIVTATPQRMRIRRRWSSDL